MNRDDVNNCRIFISRIAPFIWVDVSANLKKSPSIPAS
jgi:hypothetical protein